MIFTAAFDWTILPHHVSSPRSLTESSRIRSSPSDLFISIGFRSLVDMQSILPVMAARPSSFSIRDILKPDFGVSAKNYFRLPLVDLSVAAHKLLPAPTPIDRKFPAWIYCTRYSDRPSSGPRSRRKHQYSSTRHACQEVMTSQHDYQDDAKRPRTAFTHSQLERLKIEFETDRYLTEERRKRLAKELELNDSQIKIWFQNKRAKLKKSHMGPNPLAEQLMADGLYNHRDNVHISTP